MGSVSEITAVTRNVNSRSRGQSIVFRYELSSIQFSWTTYAPSYAGARRDNHVYLWGGTRGPVGRLLTSDRPFTELLDELEDYCQAVGNRTARPRSHT